MKRIIIIMLLAASPASAQGWSPAQQEAIDQVTRCNDGWVESIAHKKFCTHRCAQRRAMRASGIPAAPRQIRMAARMACGPAHQPPIAPCRGRT